MAVLVDRNYIATKELEDLMKMVDADEPDPVDVAALQETLKSMPFLWRAVGDMMNNAATHLIDTITIPKTMEPAGHPDKCSRPASQPAHNRKKVIAKSLTKRTSLAQKKGHSFDLLISQDSLMG